jgi:hypothetical protein
MTSYFVAILHISSIMGFISAIKILNANGILGMLEIATILEVNIY